jgi:hypothetical protein
MGETIMYLRKLLSGEAVGALTFAIPERFQVGRRATGFTLEHSSSDNGSAAARSAAGLVGREATRERAGLCLFKE